MEWLIVVLLVVICVILIFQSTNTQRAIRETNHKIEEHLHGISHRVTDIDQNLKDIHRIIVGASTRINTALVEGRMVREALEIIEKNRSEMEAEKTKPETDES